MWWDERWLLWLCTNLQRLCDAIISWTKISNTLLNLPWRIEAVVKALTMQQSSESILRTDIITVINYNCIQYNYYCVFLFSVCSHDQCLSVTLASLEICPLYSHKNSTTISKPSIKNTKSLCLLRQKKGSSFWSKTFQKTLDRCLLGGISSFYNSTS